MYAVYERNNENGKVRLKFNIEISLAGCNVGLIPNSLREKLSESDNPPAGWTLDIGDDYTNQDKAVIIDIKPRNNRFSEIFLCELVTVFGFSYVEWTPIMYRLRRLYSDIAPDQLDKNNFIYPDNPEIIYTMLYLAGSFKNGQLTGTWNYPGPSATNALLLWPEAMTFFHEQVGKFDPRFLTEIVDTIKDEKMLTPKNNCN